MDKVWGMALLAALCAIGGWLACKRGDQPVRWIVFTLVMAVAAIPIGLYRSFRSNIPGARASAFISLTLIAVMVAGVAWKAMDLLIPQCGDDQIIGLLTDILTKGGVVGLKIKDTLTEGPTGSGYGHQCRAVADFSRNGVPLTDQIITYTATLSDDWQKVYVTTP